MLHTAEYRFLGRATLPERAVLEALIGRKSFVRATWLEPHLQHTGAMMSQMPWGHILLWYLRTQRSTLFMAAYSMAKRE